MLRSPRRLTSRCSAKVPNEQFFPYDHYTGHLCGSSLVFHSVWNTSRPLLEHRRNGLTESGR
ncbi:DUF7828 domain-containing protein [Lonsdalea quercina]